jgi:hypothetical protein
MSQYYESDITRMIRELLQRRPEIVEDQKKGRALWWDKEQKPDAQKRDGESRVGQQAYVYQTKI